MPLNPATLAILLSLAAEERHGYAIMQEVTRQSNGRQKLGPGTLYDNLAKLLDQGLVEQVENKPIPGDDPRRRYYRLSATGSQVLSAEVDRLEEIVRAARAALAVAAPAGEGRA